MSALLSDSNIEHFGGAILGLCSISPREAKGLDGEAVILKELAKKFNDGG